MDYDVDYSGLGRRIRLFRMDRGMTQEQLAENVRVSRNHIAHLEAGDNVPSLALVVRISNTLKVSLDSLLSDSLDVFTEGEIPDLLGLLEGCSDNKASLLMRFTESLRNTLSDLGIE